MRILCRFGLHKWIVHHTTKGCYIFRYSLRLCSRCKKYMQSEDHLLGVNPTRYAHSWETRDKPSSYLLNTELFQDWTNPTEKERVMYEIVTGDEVDWV